VKFALHRIVARWFGYHLVRRNRLHEVLPAEHLVWLLNQMRINHVIDVGANVGQFALSLRRAGYSGRISSFEPVGETFEQLRKTASRDPEWDAHQVALGGEEAELDINVTESTTFASFLSPTQFSRDTFKRDVDVARTERVSVKRLDQLCEQLGITHTSRLFLKMDTQGFDLEVFHGAENLYSKIFGLQSEISVIPVYENMPDYLTVLATYRAKGFEPTGLFPVTRDKKRLVVIEYDCFLRNMALSE
jgi:FkbM family methyltransferase